MALKFLPEDQQNIMIPIEGLLSIKDVVKGVGQLAMRPLEPTNVESLVCSDVDGWPAIYVTKCDVGYVYFDGQHRIEAAKVLKRTTIKATCTTLKDTNVLIEYAFRANLRHGLQASQETRADYCYWLSVTFPDFTQQQIAERVGITQARVSKVIAHRKKQLQDALQEAKEQKEEERDSELEIWKEGLLKRAKTLVKSMHKFSSTLKENNGDYNDLVYNMQLELLQAPEDREALAFTGQLLLDASKRSVRRGRTS